MAERRRDAEFTEYVTARTPWLRRVAYLLSGDWHDADDLVQTTITKLYANWHRAGAVENVDGYVRTILVNTFLAEQRSMWGRRVILQAAAEDPAALSPDIDTTLDLSAALAALPPRQRATVVLRYYCDLSVEQAAQALNCSPGNVKSQTSRGIDALRRFLETPPVASPEGAQL